MPAARCGRSAFSAWRLGGLVSIWQNPVSSLQRQPTVLKKTLQCLEGIHLSQSGAVLALYVDKLLCTPFRVLARMVDTLACRRVEMLLAANLQV